MMRSWRARGTLAHLGLGAFPGVADAVLHLFPGAFAGVAAFPVAAGAGFDGVPVLAGEALIAGQLAAILVRRAVLFPARAALAIGGVEVVAIVFVAEFAGVLAGHFLDADVGVLDGVAH